jgi:pimeloyl-ACP methyl ester carboxylesterase
MAAVRLGTRFGMFNPQKVLDGASAPRDTACLTPGLRLRLIEAWREGLRQGVAGAASDARIYASPWGFDFTAITTPVTIWHGTADIVVPPATVEAYAAMPAQRHMMEGEGHYSLALSRSAEIIEALIRCCRGIRSQPKRTACIGCRAADWPRGVGSDEQGSR